MYKTNFQPKSLLLPEPVTYVTMTLNSHSGGNRVPANRKSRWEKTNEWTWVEAAAGEREQETW